MAVIARYLIDASAVLEAEALSSARGSAAYDQLWSDRRVAYEYLPIEDERWQRALQVQRELVRSGRH